MYFTKDPNDILDYSIDWAEWLGVETIASFVWTVPDGITSEEESNTDTVTLIRLSGGTDGVDYELLSHIVTSGGQETERTIIIQVRHVETVVLTGDVLDRERAIAIVTDWVQIEVVPSLTPNDIEKEVDRARLVRTWTVNTAYKVGDCVVPVDRNGHFYECIQRGTSQAGAKTYSDWPIWHGQQFSEGSSDPVLIWEEAGADIFNPGVEGAERNIYDLNRAAKNCWLLKGRKATQMFDDGNAESLSQIKKNCNEEAARFHPYRRAITLVRC